MSKAPNGFRPELAVASKKYEIAQQHNLQRALGEMSEAMQAVQLDYDSITDDELSCTVKRFVREPRLTILMVGYRI